MDRNPLISAHQRAVRECAPPHGTMSVPETEEVRILLRILKDRRQLDRLGK